MLIKKPGTESIELKNSETHYLKHLEIKKKKMFYQLKCSLTP